MKWSTARSETDLSGFEVLVSLLSPESVEVAQAAEIVYREVRARGLKALFDDRSQTAEIKGSEGARLGVPIRISVSSEGLSSGVAELQASQTGKTEKFLLEDIADKTLEVLRELKRQ